MKLKHSIPIFWLILSPVLFAQTTTDKTLRVENEFLQIIVNDQNTDKGRFSIETTKGNPDNPMDDNQPLIFGRPIPWTSYTTVLVDGQPIIFGGENKKIQKRSGQTYTFSGVAQQNRLDSGVQTLATVSDNIRVTQNLRFFRNPSTKVYDTVLISYTMTNTDTQPHQVGLRLMMDTKLGNNDGAPLRMGSIAAAAEKEIFKKDLFPFWQAFDALPEPNIVAQGTLELKEADILPPDRVVLANWGSLVDAPWDYATQEGRSFIRAGETEKDTALAMYWDPITLPPQGSRTVQTLYGLGGLSLSSGALSLGLTAPAEYAVASRREILIVGYVSNVSGYDAQDTEVTFTLPTGFAVVGGQKHFALGTLMRGETRQIPLRILPDSTVEAGPQTLVFSVTSSTLEANQIQRKIDILAPLKVSTSLGLTQVPVSLGETEVEASLTIRNPHSLPIQDIVASLKNIGKLALPPYEVTTKNIPSLAPKSSMTLNWRLRTTDKSIPTVSVTVRTPGHPPETLQSSVKLAPPQAQWQLQTSPLNGLTIGDSFYIWLAGDTLKGKSPGTVKLFFDPTQLKVIHYSAPEWASTTTLEDATDHVSISFPTGSPMASVPMGLVHFRILGGPATIRLQSPSYPDTRILITPTEVQP